MITTEFGRLVVIGATTFVFIFLMGYLRMRWQATRPRESAKVAKASGGKTLMAMK